MGKLCAVGLLVKHLFLSGACPQLLSLVQPPCEGRGISHSCSVALAGGCEGEYRNESCYHVWDSTGLALPQADVFGPCFSGLSWKRALSLSSARLSKLYCEHG